MMKSDVYNFTAQTPEVILRVFLSPVRLDVCPLNLRDNLSQPRQRKIIKYQSIPGGKRNCKS